MMWIKSNRLLPIILLVCFGFFVYYISQAIRWIPYPNSIDYGEGFVMNYAKLWANGQWKWDVNIPPYLTMVYGVGFPILSYPFVKLFGAELWVGRAISFISALVVCVLIYLIVKGISGRKGYALLASLLPATQPIFRDWSMMARVDMPAVMFDVIGFYLVMKFKNSKYIYLAIIPFVIAGMIKLTAIAGLIAVIVWLFLYNRKKLIIFSALSAFGLMMILLPLEIISKWTYLNHIITYNNTIQNIHLGTFLVLLNGFVYPFMILGVLSIFYLRECSKDGDWSLPCLFFISALMIGLLTTLRSGAASMYYLEAIIASSVSALLGFFYLSKSKILVAGVANYGFVALLVGIFVIYASKANFVLPDKQCTDEINTVKVILSDSQKPIITENPSLAMAIGKDLYIEYFIFTNMTRLGYWDETPYIKKYKEQYFDYVVLSAPIDKRIADGVLDGDFTDVVLEAIDNNYTLIYQTDNLYWSYSMFVYEANGKLKNDDRPSIKYRNYQCDGVE